MRDGAERVEQLCARCAPGSTCRTVERGAGAPLSGGLLSRVVIVLALGVAWLPACGAQQQAGGAHAAVPTPATSAGAAATVPSRSFHVIWHSGKLQVKALPSEERCQHFTGALGAGVPWQVLENGVEVSRSAPAKTDVWPADWPTTWPVEALMRPEMLPMWKSLDDALARNMAAERLARTASRQKNSHEHPLKTMDTRAETQQRGKGVNKLETAAEAQARGQKPSGASQQQPSRQSHKQNPPTPPTPKAAQASADHQTKPAVATDPAKHPHPQQQEPTKTDLFAKAHAHAQAQVQEQAHARAAAAAKQKAAADETERRRVGAGHASGALAAATAPGGQREGEADVAAASTPAASTPAAGSVAKRWDAEAVLDALEMLLERLDMQEDEVESLHGAKLDAFKEQVVWEVSCV